MAQEKKPWFPAKKYGYGWGLPNTWQGWCVLILYFVLCLVGVKWLTNPLYLLPFFMIYIVLISGLLVYVCWKKGEQQKG